MGLKNHKDFADKVTGKKSKRRKVISRLAPTGLRVYYKEYYLSLKWAHIFLSQKRLIFGVAECTVPICLTI
jgi:hypothetical protein